MVMVEIFTICDLTIPSYFELLAMVMIKNCKPNGQKMMVGLPPPNYRKVIHSYYTSNCWDGQLWDKKPTFRQYKIPKAINGQTVDVEVADCIEVQEGQC